MARGDCLSLKDLAITGNDLIHDGISPGRLLGDVLNQLLDDVLADPAHNERTYLIERSRELRREWAVFPEEKTVAP